MRSGLGVQATTLSGALLGVTATVVRIEVRIRSTGFPGFHMVGLADTSVRESRVRVLAALDQAGHRLGSECITVNLAPADVPKSGSALDLALAVGLLAAAGFVPSEPLATTMLLGEIGLGGDLRPVSGVLPCALAALREGMKELIVPEGNAAEASLAEGLDVRAARTIGEVISHMRGESALPLHPPLQPSQDLTSMDMADVRGQAAAKRALEVAAAGGHNVLLVGPPGSGKTMLARALASILAPMTREQMLETASIHSSAGLMRGGAGPVRSRPFRAPHHSVSPAGLVGGGCPPRPGEVSLAHNGVLFLDELPEFGAHCLDMLREPLEAGRVTVVRAWGSLTFPSAFTLVAAMNPCRCGHDGDRRHPCTCSPPERQRYAARISGPLLDRMDIRVLVPALSWNEIASGQERERSEDVRGRVAAVRSVQHARLIELPPAERCNARIPGKLLQAICAPDRGAMLMIEKVVDGMGLTARGYTRLLRVARTIADLEVSGRVLERHIAEAAQYCRPRDADAGRNFARVLES